MCCKCCQSCLESCYWHCFEKWFCYDENIALYEEPCVEEKERRSYDNMAFWDSVAVIANRSVVTIQPLPNKNDSLLNVNNNNQNPGVPEVPDTVDHVIKITEPTPPKIKLRKHSAVDEKIEQRLRTESTSKEQRSRKQSAIEELIEQRQRSESNAHERQRKKSLKERRKSAAGLTLKLDNDFHEIPVIRQSSMPKFFLDTPEIDLRGNYSDERSSVLVSPVLGNSPTFSYDLKSIVQIENEIMAHQSKPSTPKASRTNSRLNQVRKKLKPIIIKKPSSKSLPDSIHHM